jgi:hypothetical protein
VPWDSRCVCACVCVCACDVQVEKQLARRVELYQESVGRNDELQVCVCLCVCLCGPRSVAR